MSIIPPPPQAMQELETYLGAFTNYETQQPLPSDRRALGPARAEALLEAAGLLPPQPCVVQIAGSKGKGSTLLYAEAFLRARGERPGGYLSPHLQRINERVRIDGSDSSDEDVLRALAALHPLLADLEATPTFFDLWTAVAAWLFDDAKLTHALYEVGLGGPLDSTSAMPHDVGVLTSIDLEHRHLLGETHEEIACEKARIARAGKPFVVAELDTSWGQAAAAVATERGARVIGVDPADARIPEQFQGGWRRNVATALATVEQGVGLAPFDSDEVVRVVMETPLPGRLEVLRNPPVLIDCAHTRRSMQLFRDAFERFRDGRAGMLLCGFMADKEWQQIVDVFPAESELRWIVTTPNAKRRLPPEPLVAYLEERFSSVSFLEDPREALAVLREAAKDADVAAGITGSFHLAGLARGEW